MKQAIVLTLLMSANMIIGCSGRQIPESGIVGGRLPACPDRPNCVNSQAPEGRSAIAPMHYTCTRKEARLRLLTIIENTSRTRILTRADDYIRVEYRSRIFRFVDDVEFYFPEEAVIHVRSASRVGYSDLGANRRRVESIRRQFADQNQ